MKKTCYAIRLIFFSFGLGIASWAPLVPIVKSELDLDDAALGATLLVMGLGALIMMPLTGWIMNKVGSKSIIFISGLGVISILPLLTLASTPLSFCSILFLFGTATGAMNVSMNSQAVDIEVACKVPILSGIHCWFSLGGLLGAGLMSFLLKLGFEVPYCSLAISTLIFLSLIMGCPYLLHSPVKQIQSGKLVVFNSPALFLGGLCFIAFMAEGSMLDWSAEYLSSYKNYDSSSAGIGYALFSISMAFGRLTGDRMIQKFGLIPIFQMGCLLAASGFLILITPSLGYSELFGFCLIGFGASNIVPILFSCSGKLSEIPSHIALTLITTCGYVGLLLGPAFIGFLAQATSLSVAFGGIALLLMAIGFSCRTAMPAFANLK